MEYLNQPDTLPVGVDIPTNVASRKGGGVSLDIKSLLFRILRNWWLILLGLAIGYTVAKLYLRYREVTYLVSAVVQIDQESNQGISERVVAQELGFNEEQNLETEIQKIKSRSLLELVIKDLNLDVNFYADGRVRNSDLYGFNNKPIIIEKAEPTSGTYGKLLTFNLLNNGQFAFGYEDKLDTFRLGLPFSNAYGNFLFSLDTLASSPKERLLIEFKNPLRLARSYSSRLKVSSISTSKLLEISMEDNVPERASDIIQGVINTYDSITIRQKSQTGIKTLEFIDERVSEFNRDLTQVEQQAEDFISNNNLLVDIPTNLQLQLSEFRQTEEQLAQSRLQLSAIDNLAQYMQSGSSEYQLIPFGADVANLNVSGMIQRYNQLLLERTQLLATASASNPTVVATEQPLRDLRSNILDAIARARAEIQREVIKVERENAAVLARVRGVPGQRRRLLGIEREQEIKEKLYLYLLQKKEETELAQAVTASGMQLVEEPINEGPIGPQSSQVYLIGLLVGMFIPIGLITSIELLDNTIKSIDQIKGITDIPVVGAIGTVKGKENIVVEAGSRTAVAEMFRAVRTNLAFIGAGRNQKVILITSSMSGEGKSFISVNLGMSLAIGNSKVCLVGMDLRKPKLEIYLSNKQTSNGVSNFLVKEDMSVSEIINQSGLHPNLDYIGSGPVPPNPAELLMTDRVKILIQDLRERYDYVFIDSPPVGAVVDAFLLRPMIDSTIYITRFNKTNQDQLEILMDAVAKDQLVNPSIILNAVKTGRRYGGYGYGYGYYESE